MPHLSIKDVPEAWAEALRQRAARNHRSLQGELLAIVEQAVKEPEPVSVHTAAMAPQPQGARVVGHDARGHPIIRQGWKTVEQVVAELKAKYPDPIVNQSSSIELIREDRDSR